jgi:hypothetical protein
LRTRTWSKKTRHCPEGLNRIQGSVSLWLTLLTVETDDDIISRKHFHVIGANLAIYLAK